MLGYPGLMLPSRKLHLIILVGFEFERAEYLISFTEPDFISLGKTKYSDFEKSPNFEIKKKFHQHVVNFIDNISLKKPRINTFEFSTSDPIAAAKSILVTSSKLSHCDVAVAPMNTKISTLGAGLAAIKDSEMQLIYAQATEYNVQGYSEPSGFCEIFDIAKLLSFLK